MHESVFQSRSRLNKSEGRVGVDVFQTHDRECMYVFQIHEKFAASITPFLNLNLNLLINIDFATIKVEIHLSFTRLVILIKEGYINIFTEAYLLKYTIINR